jgi:hypothetical protein
MTEQIENVIFGIFAIVAIVGVVALWRIGTWVKNVYYAIEDMGWDRCQCGIMPDHTAGSIFHDDAGNHSDLLK